MSYLRDAAEAALKLLHPDLQEAQALRAAITMDHYTCPRPPVRKPLTDEELIAIDRGINPLLPVGVGKWRFAREIEKAHGIGVEE
jgi:hypothetical protein